MAEKKTTVKDAVKTTMGKAGEAKKAAPKKAVSAVQTREGINKVSDIPAADLMEGAGRHSQITILNLVASSVSAATQKSEKGASTLSASTSAFIFDNAGTVGIATPKALALMIAKESKMIYEKAKADNNQEVLKEMITAINKGVFECRNGRTGSDSDSQLPTLVKGKNTLSNEFYVRRLRVDGKLAPAIAELKTLITADLVDGKVKFDKVDVNVAFATKTGGKGGGRKATAKVIDETKLSKLGNLF